MEQIKSQLKREAIEVIEEYIDALNSKYKKIRFIQESIPIKKNARQNIKYVQECANTLILEFEEIKDIIISSDIHIEKGAEITCSDNKYVDVEATYIESDAMMNEILDEYGAKLEECIDKVNGIYGYQYLFGDDV